MRIGHWLKLRLFAASRRVLFAWRRWWLVRVGVVGVVVAVLAGICVEMAAQWLPFDGKRFEPRYTSTVVRDRHSALLRVYLSDDQCWRIPAKISEISPSMVSATLAAEDRRFYNHDGVDWLAVARAAVDNLQAGRIVSGASTISMQVAGFGLDSRERSAWRKLHQAFLALQIERHWTKQQILEAYLTRASYGGNICGVEAAALRYFDKSARDLTTGEAALLAGLPQSPERFRPDRHSAAALRRREYVLGRMAETGAITQEDFRRATVLPLALKVERFPVRAPHLCDELRRNYPSRAKLQSTIDQAVQSRAEQAVSAAVKARSAEGVTNGAAVVLDNRTGELLAMVGSADFWSRSNDGQVNGALAYRSPGSALKPLIYARALDIGAITPDETLFDVPITQAGYSPQNFDKQFRGPVAAPKALAWSLNIPAMEVLQRVGVPEFSGFLTSHDVGLRINKNGDAGLSLAIGTCSVRLIDLVQAYASLADDGKLKPVRWLADEKRKQAVAHRQWISPGAAAVVLQTLADEGLRAPEDVDPRLQGLRGVAWKTGTSNGLRDAWTIAVAKDVTVGVWLGNMDGRASRALIGSKAAAPVALELVSAVSRNAQVGSGGVGTTWPDGLDGTVLADACDVSGLPATASCPGHVRRRFLRGHVRDHRCRAHEVVELDRHSGFCLCSQCRRGSMAEQAVRLQFAPEIATWLRSSGHPWAEMLAPPHNPACAVGGAGETPAIVHPAPGTEIVLLSELPLEQQKIALTARTANPAEQLFWFINGTLAGTAAAADSLVISPQPGRNRIVCTNSRGGSAETWFTVQKPK